MKHRIPLLTMTAAFALLTAAGCTPAEPVMPLGSSTTEAAPARLGDAAEQNPAPSPPPTDASTESTPTERPRPPAREEIERISFEDLNCNIQANIVFREWMLTDRARELDGKRVRLAGYMLSDLKIKDIEEFVLLKNTECKFGPDGQADHLAMIKLNGDLTTNFTDKPIDVIGTLRFEPFPGPDGNTWAIYEIEAEAIQPMRR